MSMASTTRTKAFLRNCFPWVTWGQKARSVALGTALLVAASLLSFWAYGRLCITFYKPEHMITLSGKIQTQCVGRYLVDVPVELGRLGIQSSQFIYGLTRDFEEVTVDVKAEDFTRAQFEKTVQARADDLKRYTNNWGTSKLLTQEMIDTPNGKALLLRYLNRGDVDARIKSELHILVGSRYVLLKSNSYNTPCLLYTSPSPRDS